jgi:hypothetical protein
MAEKSGVAAGLGFVLVVAVCSRVLPTGGTRYGMCSFVGSGVDGQFGDANEEQALEQALKRGFVNDKPARR